MLKYLLSFNLFLHHDGARLAASNALSLHVNTSHSLIPFRRRGVKARGNSWPTRSDGAKYLEKIHPIICKSAGPEQEI
jgi:hypothetical protein